MRCGAPTPHMKVVDCERHEARARSAVNARQRSLRAHERPATRISATLPAKSGYNDQKIGLRIHRPYLAGMKALVAASNDIGAQLCPVMFRR
jgi:hypothetical protein